jgi:hypothetical protein
LPVFAVASIEDFGKEVIREFERAGRLMELPSEPEMRPYLREMGWAKHPLYEMWEDPLYVGKWYGLEAAYREQEKRENREKLTDRVHFYEGDYDVPF